MAAAAASSPTNSDASKSSFQKTVCLRDWWLVKPSEGNRLAVAGTTYTMKQAVREFYSAPIQRRYDCFTLETVDNICIIFKGFLDRARTVENGFPSEVCAHFIFGFPPDWETYSLNCFEGESLTQGAKPHITASGLQDLEDETILKTPDPGPMDGGIIQRTPDSRPIDCEMIQKTPNSRPINSEMIQKTPNSRPMDGETIQRTSDSRSINCEITQRTPESTKFIDGERIQRTPNARPTNGEVIQTISNSRPGDGERIQKTPESRPIDSEIIQRTPGSTQPMDGEIIPRTPDSTGLMDGGEHIQRTLDSRPMDGEIIQRTPDSRTNDGEMIQRTPESRPISSEMTRSTPNSKFMDNDSSQKHHISCNIGGMKRGCNNNSFSVKTRKSNKTLRSSSRLCKTGNGRNNQAGVCEERAFQHTDFLEKSRKASKSNLSRKKKDESFVSPECSNLKRSRSGRLLVPKLEFWRNQRAIYDADRQITGIEANELFKGLLLHSDMPVFDLSVAGIGRNLERGIDLNLSVREGTSLESEQKVLERLYNLQIRF